jgi:arylformamidase
MLDAKTREREYSPSSCIGGNYQPFIRAYAERSAAARACTKGQLGLRYGKAPAQQLDLFMPAAQGGTRPPLLLFIHGGYWQELSKDDSSFAAGDCVPQGIAYAAIDYTLAPQAGLAQIVAECCAAFDWLHGQADTLGFDAQRIVIAGSSAGAHLAAMVALHAAGARQALAGVVLLSGIYALEPLIGTSINDAVGLDVISAQALSPALAPLAGFAPCIVSWGEVETQEFKRQSREFAAALKTAGTRCTSLEVPQRNHFDIVFDLADAHTALGAATLALIRST